MKKMPSKAVMVKREARETRAQEKAETPAYQQRETRLGVEKHAQPKKKGR